MAHHFKFHKIKNHLSGGVGVASGSHPHQYGAGRWESLVGYNVMHGARLCSSDRLGSEGWVFSWCLSLVRERLPLKSKAQEPVSLWVLRGRAARSGSGRGGKPPLCFGFLPKGPI